MENPNPPQVVKPSEWVLTLFIASIPLVGIIMLFVWAFGDTTNINKANWAKGALILIAIFIALYIFIALIFGAALFSAFS
jgi:hypothetical protein